MGGLVFASFSCFWTTLAFMLQTRYGMGPGVVKHVWCGGSGRCTDRAVCREAFGPAGNAVRGDGGGRDSERVLCLAVAIRAGLCFGGAAHSRAAGGSCGAGRWRTDDAGGQSDAHLRAGGAGARSRLSTDLHDDVLHRGSAGFGGGDAGVVAVAVGRCVRAGADVHRGGGCAAHDGLQQAASAASGAYARRARAEPA